MQLEPGTAKRTQKSSHLKGSDDNSFQAKCYKAVQCYCNNKQDLKPLGNASDESYSVVNKRLSNVTRDAEAQWLIAVVMQDIETEVYDDNGTRDSLSCSITKMSTCFDKEFCDWYLT